MKKGTQKFFMYWGILSASLVALSVVMWGVTLATGLALGAGKNTNTDNTGAIP